MTQPYPGQPFLSQPGPYQAGPPRRADGRQPASFGRRAGAFVVDGLLGSVAAAPIWVGLVMSTGDVDKTLMGYNTAGDPVYYEQPVGLIHSQPALSVVLVGMVTSLTFWLWNYARQGRTGATVGKSALGIEVVNQADGQHVGVGKSLARSLLTGVVNGTAVCLGYLWAIWDSENQTWNDKVFSTLVLSRPR